LKQRHFIHDGIILSEEEKLSRRKNRARHHAMRGSALVGASQTILSGDCSITLAALGRVEIHAADHHGQRHGVDFNRQRSGVPASGNLEAPAFQSLRPNDKPITIPKQNLASIPRAIQEDEIIAAENVHAERMGDD
jgi:hypothetical protein